MDRWRGQIIFTFLEIETIGSCNRTCPTCIRNSHPDRDAVASWFEHNYLEEDLIYEAVEQAINMGYRGGVCLAHYNEPLMDVRLPRIAQTVKLYSAIKSVHTNTNGDYITPELAAELDGSLDYINVALYMKDPKKSERIAWIKTLFKKTKVNHRDGPHMPTHFSPAFDLDDMVPVARGNICKPTRVIINHRRQYLLCCDDVIGNFDLGTFPEISIKNYWHGTRSKIADDLSRAGGRKAYPYCMSCPATAPIRKKHYARTAQDELNIVRGAFDEMVREEL